MTFGPDHYVPVLKVKRGERKALQRVSSIHQSRITPLLEIVKLDTAFTDLAEAVRPYS